MTPLISAPFVQLPLVVNTPRLLREIQALDKSHWRAHHFDTLQSIPLVDMDPFEPFWYDASYHLPYLMRILNSWEAPIGKSRISILKPNAAVEEHVDVDYYWKYRLRVHIVVKSNPKAIFGCDNQTLQLPEGQVWVSNNWAPHWIANYGDTDRIHIVVDTMGSPKLWDLISKGWHSNSSTPLPKTEQLDVVQVNQDVHNRPCLEKYSTLHVRHPSEVETILKDTLEELVCQHKEPHRAVFKQLIQEWHDLFRCHQHSQRRAYNALLQRTISTLPHSHLHNGLAIHTVLQKHIGGSLRPTPNREPILFSCPAFLKEEGHRLLNICLNNIDKRSQLTTDPTSFQSAWKHTIEPHTVITQHVREQWFEKLIFCLYNPESKVFWLDENSEIMQSKRLWLHNTLVSPQDIHTWRALFPMVKIIFLFPSDTSSTNSIRNFSDDLQTLWTTYHQQVHEILMIHPDESSIVLAENHSSSIENHTTSAIEKLNHWLDSTLSVEKLFSEKKVSSSQSNDLEDDHLNILETVPPISEDDLG